MVIEPLSRPSRQTLGVGLLLHRPNNPTTSFHFMFSTISDNSQISSLPQDGSMLSLDGSVKNIAR